MKKLYIIGTLVVLVIIIVLFVGMGRAEAPVDTSHDAFGDLISPDDEISPNDLPNSSSDSATEVIARGVVRLIDRDGLMVDGPALINIEKDNGEDAVIAVPARINLCVARDNIKEDTIQVGMTIEVRGTWTSSGEIVPCEGESHYLKIIK